MNRLRRIIAAALVLAIVSLSVNAQTQRRRSPATAGRGAAGAQSLLTGVYRLDSSNSDDPRVIAERSAVNLDDDERQRVVYDLTTRLTAPDLLAIERRNFTIDIASSRAPRISFEADGRERTEQATDGHEVRTRAVLYGDNLMVTSGGSPDDEFSVAFDPIDGGRRLRVTRRIFSSQLKQQLVIQSIYNKTSNVARWGIFREPAVTASNTPPPPATDRRNRPQPAPPVIRNRPPQPATVEAPPPDALFIPDGTEFVAVLNNDLSTAQSREGDRFTMTVHSPGQYDGATIEGFISNVRRGGRLSGRSEMLFNFERIRLRDGRTASFAGFIESVRPVGNEEVRVDTESGGSVQERNNRSGRTAQRAAIGAAVGAIIGAIAGGGRGAAIGAAIGAGAGAGSIYAEGRGDLELRNGTEMTIRTS